MSKQKKRKASPNGITLGMASVILMTVSMILILSMAKIYLSNKIYKESKVVNKYKSEVATLKAENIILKQNVEALKFKHRVADTIFIIEDMEDE